MPEKKPGIKPAAARVSVMISDCDGNEIAVCFDTDWLESEDQIEFYSNARGKSSMLCVTRYNIISYDSRNDSRLGFYEIECWDKDILDHIERFADERELQDWIRSFCYKHGATITR